MNKKIAIIVIILIIVGAGIIGAITLMNKEKTPITAEKFRITMKQKDYVINDVNDQFSEYDTIKQVYVASDSSYNYQIEFYELSDELSATSFYNSNVANIQAVETSTSAQTSINGKNYSKYTLSTGEEYMVISRIGNTILYFNVNSNYKNEVKKIVEELGY